jgi:hypothetical protein
VSKDRIILDSAVQIIIVNSKSLVQINFAESP